MGDSEIPDEDWKIIKKYTKEKILRRFLKEESLQKPKKDLFFFLIPLTILCLYGIIFLSNKMYFHNDSIYLLIITILTPAIIAFSVIILGYYFGTRWRYQISFPIIILLINYAYFSLSAPVNLPVFILFSISGIILGFYLGYMSVLLFVEDTIIGNPEDFNIEVLKHSDDLESYESIFKNYINQVISLKILPTYDDKNKKIFQKAGFSNIFLLYVICGNSFAFFTFSKNGKYLYQDKRAIELQKKISFLLKNSLNLKETDTEEQRIAPKNSCLDLLAQYKMNVFMTYIKTHKKEIGIGSLSIIFTILAGLVLMSYSIDIIFKNTIITVVVPIVVTIITLYIIKYLKID